VQELIALAKARPGELNFSTGPIGSYPFLSANLFRSMAGVKIVGISYKGSGGALTAVISGEVQMTFATPGSLAPHVKSKRLKALAVTSAEPSVLAPGLPTIAASGVPGYESVAAQGIFAPAGTPVAIVNRLNQEVVRLITQPNVKEQLLTLGLETVGSSPEQLAAAMQAEIVKWGKVIKDAGIRAE
jgi:tripartite-type tricarboxylate transporter receptor subunit TctC